MRKRRYKKNKKFIMKFSGVFANDEGWKKIMDKILENRKKFKLREIKF